MAKNKQNGMICIDLRNRIDYHCARNVRQDERPVRFSPFHPCQDCGIDSKTIFTSTSPRETSPWEKDFAAGGTPCNDVAPSGSAFSIDPIWMAWRTAACFRASMNSPLIKRRP